MKVIEPNFAPSGALAAETKYVKQLDVELYREGAYATWRVAC